jgi:tetratricopeptide (TPR) repeat protein
LEAKLEENELEICQPGDLLDQADDNKADSDNDIEPIGQSSPPLMSGTDEEAEEVAKSEDRDDSDSGKITKLSEEQVKNIRSKLLNTESQEYVNPGDASSIISDLSGSEQEFDEKAHQPELVRKKSTPPPPPGTKSPEKDISLSNENTHPGQPQAIGSQGLSTRRMAYFHKNFVQLTGPMRPVSGEELVIGDRHYLLKPKRIKQQYAIAAFSALIVILLFIVGYQFVSPTLPGSGSIIGVVLDKTGKPANSSVEVALPEAGRRVMSNSEGFFRFDKVPTGIYVLRFKGQNDKVMTANVSVVSDQITLLSIGADNPSEKSNVRTASIGGRTSPPYPGRQIDKRPTRGSESSKPAQPQTKPSKPAKEYSALKLKANVDKAKLAVNGEVFGKGNLTYKKLSPGKHSVVVSRDGYKPWKGKVHLKPSETYTLSVTLEKLSVETQEETYSANDFYESGRTMLVEGNAASAVDDFTEAINMMPSMADAYGSRAEAHGLLGNNGAAEMDYIRAGEIYVTQKRYQAAMTMFNNAIEINNNSIPAFLNRGDLHRRQDNRSGALDDYKSVVKIDKNNFRGNFGLGKIYFSMGKHKDADKKLHKAKEIDSRVPEVYHYLMLNYLARDDFDKVKKTYGDFKNKITEDDVQAFRDNQRFDAILRIVGEYERP